MTKAVAKKMARTLLTELQRTADTPDAIRYLMHLGLTDEELTRDLGCDKKDVEVARALSHSTRVPKLMLAWMPPKQK